MALATLPRVGDQAPDLVLPDDAGHETRLADLWRRQPTAFIFLRHYG